MYCSHCGTSSNDDARFCHNCGALLATTPGMSAPAAVGFGPPGPYGAAPVLPPKTSRKAVASFILGFLSLMLPAAIAAIFLGHIARSDIRRSAGRLAGEKMALVGLVLGYFGITAIPIFVAAVILNVFESPVEGNEAVAIASLRTIFLAQKVYANSHPNLGFSCELSSLGGAGGSSGGAGLIDGVLAGGEKSGYKFEISNCAGKLHKSYTLVAYPRVIKTTGRRAFCVDETGMFKVDEKGSAGDCITSGKPLS